MSTSKVKQLKLTPKNNDTHNQSSISQFFKMDSISIL